MSTWAQQVRPGQLLVVLDDTNARARLAAATAALRTAEAGYQSVEAAGSHQEQLALAGNLSKATIDRDQAAKDIDVIENLAAKGAAAPSEVTQAQLRLQVANARSAHTRRTEDETVRARGSDPGPVERDRSRGGARRRGRGHRAIECARSLRGYGLFPSRHALRLHRARRRDFAGREPRQTAGEGVFRRTRYRRTWNSMIRSASCGMPNPI